MLISNSIIILNFEISCTSQIENVKQLPAYLEMKHNAKISDMQKCVVYDSFINELVSQKM